MPIFNVQDAFGGNAVTFGPNYKGVEIVIDRSGLHQFRDYHILSPVLASKQEVDEAIRNLIADLEVVRVIAVKKLEERPK